MFVKTLLVVIFMSKVSSETFSGSCGCAVQTTESFHQNRIPSGITELYCRKSGATCGLNSLSRVSWNLLGMIFKNIDFDSAINWPDVWTLDTPKIPMETKWLCTKETLPLALVAFANLPRFNVSSSPSNPKLWMILIIESIESPIILLHIQSSLLFIK